MPIEIRMPRLAGYDAQGAVVAWRKQEVSRCGLGEVIAEIEADKATVDLAAARRWDAGPDHRARQRIRPSSFQLLLDPELLDWGC